MEQATSTELRCFCRRTPLLAVYGLDTKGDLYIHVKVYKNRRIFGEMLVTDGVVHLRCRECMRWHRVLINQPKKKATLTESTPIGPFTDPKPDHD